MFVATHELGGGVSPMPWSTRLRQVLVVGICTDICVMDFVLTLLSARNHGIAGGRTQHLYTLMTEWITENL